jgi:ornithine cyclodeaminase/alanine dehydrogenase-like protein (mu-crystallin family)
LQAVCSVRKIRRVLVYSRDAERRENFAREMSQLLGVAVEPADDPKQAAAEKGIVITTTTSKTPVFDDRDLSPGTHLNAIGSNFLSKAEIDIATIERAGRVVCDSIPACQLEAGDFVPALQAGKFDWANAVDLGDVVAGRRPGRRTPEEITLFKSVGLALEDLAVAVLVYERAQR